MGRSRDQTNIFRGIRQTCKPLRHSASSKKKKKTYIDNYLSNKFCVKVTLCVTSTVCIVIQLNRTSPLIWPVPSNYQLPLKMIHAARNTECLVHFLKVCQLRSKLLSLCSQTYRTIGTRPRPPVSVCTQLLCVNLNKPIPTSRGKWTSVIVCMDYFLPEHYGVFRKCVLCLVSCVTVYVLCSCVCPALPFSSFHFFTPAPYVSVITLSIYVYHVES